MLVYSINNISFSNNSASQQTLIIQISLEEKNFANVISNTVSQVYAQGPGSKATAYIKLTYLRDSRMLEKAFGLNNPYIFVTYDRGVNITVINSTTPTLTFEGPDKNVFWSASLYPAVLYNNSNIWDATFRNSITINGTTVYGLMIPPSDFNSTIRVVVEWNPSLNEIWSFNSSSGYFYININPGG
ncbi:class III signal peptide-containing protein [Thermococcus sp.]